MLSTYLTFFFSKCLRRNYRKRGLERGSDIPKYMTFDSLSGPK